MEDFKRAIRAYITESHTTMFRPGGDGLPYAFITPGSDQYPDVLWDWDSWLTNIALRQLFSESGDTGMRESAEEYERGCILNFLHVAKQSDCIGWIPIRIERGGVQIPGDPYLENMHKPCLAQHAAFLVREGGGDAEWLREDAMYLQYFINNYRNHHRHACGLYFWQSSAGVGVDNDPSTFGRPRRSSGSIYLNCLMYRELLALAYILDCLKLDEVAAAYRKDAADLKAAVLEHCWDERDGFFYSVDLNLTEPQRQLWTRHSGQVRDWPCLIQRIGMWSGFMALWAGIATSGQAERVVKEHYTDRRTFNAPYGVRTLSKLEKMYNLRASGNPSSWLGPVWGISNYMTWRGLVQYGFEAEARELAEKTVRLFGEDLERTGGFHEYYQPENGMPILNIGFQNWNLLVLNMMAWLEGRDPVVEF